MNTYIEYTERKRTNLRMTSPYTQTLTYFTHYLALIFILARSTSHLGRSEVIHWPLFLSIHVNISFKHYGKKIIIIQGQ